MCFKLIKEVVKEEGNIRSLTERPVEDHWETLSKKTGSLYLLLYVFVVSLITRASKEKIGAHPQ